MQELGDSIHGLWTFHQPLSVLGAQIGCRMTVIRLGGSELLVHSPIALALPLRRRLDELGRVRHVFAPNLDHYLFVPGFAQAYPEARFYAAPGVAAKLPSIRFDVVLEHPATIADWDDTVDQVYFRSNDELQELVLFHRATRTLITADLAFNIQSSEGLLSRLLLRLNDSYETFGPSRVCRRHITAPRMARADVDAIIALGPERLVMSHGEPLLSGAAEALRQAYAWLR